LSYELTKFEKHWLTVNIKYVHLLSVHKCKFSKCLQTSFSAAELAVLAFSMAQSELNAATVQ